MYYTCNQIKELEKRKPFEGSAGGEKVIKTAAKEKLESGAIFILNYEDEHVNWARVRWPV